MKSFEELVEEVYQNVELRKEFIKYVRLKSFSKNKTESYLKDFPQLYSNNIRYSNYQETMFIKPDFYIEADEVNRNILYLSSSLFRILSQKYKLAATDVRRLREAVADKYENEL